MSLVKNTLRATAGLSLLIAIAACTGGGGKSADKGLTSGTYAWRDVQATDGCQFLDDFGFVQDVEVGVLVNTTSVVIDAVPMALDTAAGTFATTFSYTLDWRDDAVPYDCVETDTYSIAGEITGANEALVDVTIGFTAVTGTGCNFANAPVTLPCTSSGSARLERL